MSFRVYCEEDQDLPRFQGDSIELRIQVEKALFFLSFNNFERQGRSRGHGSGVSLECQLKLAFPYTRLCAGDGDG
jgi:hypothetical protein